MNTEDEEATVSVTQAHEMIGKRQVSRGAFYAAIRRGDVPCIKIGSRLLIPRRWIVDKLASTTTAQK
jgi:hypothetical protein